MEFSQTRGNCAYSPAIIPLSISVLSYSNLVDTSLMSDLYFAWTSVVSSCTYTCELKAIGCKDQYEGFFLSMIGNLINGAQNEKAGWNE